MEGKAPDEEFPDLASALAEISRLRKENKNLTERAKTLAGEIRRAKDISPVQRPSFLRVTKLVRAACMDLKKISCGWLLSLGKNLTRKFTTLKQIWELLIQDNWHLTEIFGVSDPEADSKPEHIFLKKSYNKFLAIPFCDDGLIDSDALGIYAADGDRAPPVATW